MKYALQEKNFGLGNFIMLTPALQLLPDKVNVYFHDKKIQSLYRDCPFFNILKKRPKNKPFISSRRPYSRKKKESDTLAYCRILFGDAKSVPNTYIDKCQDYKLDKKNIKHVAIFHGCLGTIYRKKKDIGLETRQYIIDSIIKKGYVPVILGLDKDAENYWNKNNLDGCVNLIGMLSLRESVSVLDQCDFFMSNDTGLYHAAGALEKPGLVMWYKTNMIKNMCVFNGIEHTQTDDRLSPVYERAVDRFLEKQ